MISDNMAAVRKLKDGSEVDDKSEDYNEIELLFLFAVLHDLLALREILYEQARCIFYKPRS